MAIKAEVVRQAARTGTPGTQDFTFAGFGAVKAAIVKVTYATGDGVAADNDGLSYGLTDGISQCCVHGNSENGQVTSDAHSEISTVAIINLNTPGTSTGIAVAVLDSIITDGIRLDWSVVGSAYLVTVTLLGGDTLSAFLGNQLLTNTVDTPHVVSNIGFEPFLAFTAMAETRNEGSLQGGNSRYSLGVVHNDGAGGITSRSYAHNEQTSVNPSRVSTFLSATYGLVHQQVNTGAIDFGVEYGAFGPAGFTVTERIAGANNTLIFHLCLASSDPGDFAVGTHSTPTTPEETPETGPNFEPQYVMLGMTLLPTVDSGQASGDGSGTNGIGVFTATAQFSNSVQSEDAVSPTNTQSLSDDTAVLLSDDDGTPGIVGGRTSMTPTGFIMGYTTTKASIRRFWYAAIKSFPAAGGDTFNEHPWVVPTTWYLPYWKHR